MQTRRPIAILLLTAGATVTTLHVQAAHTSSRVDLQAGLVPSHAPRRSVPSIPQLPRAFQAQAAPGASQKEMATRGEAAFSRHCAICHLGRPNKANPFIGRNLRGLLKNAKPEHETAVRDAIKKGSDHMPAFQYTLAPAQMEDLVGYLKTYN